MPLVSHKQISCNWKNDDDCAIVVAFQLLMPIHTDFKLYFLLLSAHNNGFGCDNFFNHFCSRHKLWYTYLCVRACVPNIDLRAHARSHTVQNVKKDRKNKKKQIKSTANWAIEQIEKEKHTCAPAIGITLSIFNMTTWNMKWLYCYLMSMHTEECLTTSMLRSSFFSPISFPSPSSSFHLYLVSNTPRTHTLCSVSVNIQRMCKSFLDNCFDGTERARHRKNEAIEAL